MSEQSSISLGGIEERAQKLEETIAKEKAEPAAAAAPVAGEAAPAAAPAAIVPGQAPAAKAVESEKKAPNDPEELRKWNTKVSMELAEVRKQLTTLAETLNKTARKQVDWKDLAKDPVKLQAAIEEQRKQDAAEHTEKFNKASLDSTSRITRLENKARMTDPAYPRWAELQPVLQKLALAQDSRINFNQDPAAVLDQMYDVAKEMHPNPVAAAPAAAAPAAPAAKTFTEAELAAKIEEARKEAVAEAQKGLANETKGQGIGSMGKGATKGNGGVDKAALQNMPLNDLKKMIQAASDK